MKNITPLGDKVLGRMLEVVGQERHTDGGLIITEDTMTEGAIRPRWFEITHVGPKQQEFSRGDYVLVAHGRWSRGIDVDGTKREEDKLFLLDTDEFLGASDIHPLEK